MMNCSFQSLRGDGGFQQVTISLYHFKSKGFDDVVARLYVDHIRPCELDDMLRSRDSDGILWIVEF